MTKQQKVVVQYLESKHWEISEKKGVLVAFDPEGQYVNIAASFVGEEIYPIDMENRDSYDRIDVVKVELYDEDTLRLYRIVDVIPTRVLAMKG